MKNIIFYGRDDDLVIDDRNNTADHVKAICKMSEEDLMYISEKNEQGIDVEVYIDEGIINKIEIPKIDENRKKEVEKKYREITEIYEKRGAIECDIPLDLDGFTVAEINYMIKLEEENMGKPTRNKRRRRK